MQARTLAVKLVFSQSDVRLTYTLYGVEIALSGGQIPEQPGAPGFPQRIAGVALPEGTEVSGISGHVLRAVPLTRNPTMVAPIRGSAMPPPHSETPTTPAPRWESPNPDLYEAALDRKTPLVRLTAGWIEGRVAMAGVIVSPIRYDGFGCLELVSEMEITLTLRPATAKHPRLLRAEQRPAWSRRRHLLAAATALNPEVVEALHDATSVEIESEPPIGETTIPMDGAIPIKVPRFVDYLIVTDDNAWDANGKTATAPLGAITAAFQRLANWKADRGLRTHVACLQDIVDGAYGDFTTGTRDLQEVIRNFLKDFVWRHDTDWLLLGGGIDIIPPRYACGGMKDGCLGFVPAGSALKVNSLLWKGNFLGMQVDPQLFGDPADDTLTMLATGTIVPYDAAGAAGVNSPRWYHTTDDSFATFSAVRTAFIRVDGPANLINGKVQWYRYEGRIPTDHYYASLYAPTYDVPGRHDWDLLDNSLYGQWSETSNMDGIDYWGDVYVGRAPVESAAEANVFVDKVIAYEQAAERPSDYHRFNRMLLVAEHLGDVYRFGHVPRSTGDVWPPSNQTYSHDPVQARTVINAPIADNGFGFELLCRVADDEFRRIPYNSHAGPASRGWYFVQNWSLIEPSEFHLPPLPGPIPIPTQWILVYSPDPAELTPSEFVLDETGLDLAIREQESLRELMAKNVPSLTEVRRVYEYELDLPDTAISAAPLRRLTSAAIRAELNDGPHLVAMTGHGWFGGGCQFGEAELNALTNGDRTFIIYADSCYTNEFDHTSHKTISRLALVAPNGGAVAYVQRT